MLNFYNILLYLKISFYEYPDTYYMWFHCFLASDGSENACGYMQNDPFSIKFELNFLNNEYILINISNCYCVKPKNKYLWCEYEKTSFRKTVGDFEKIKKSFANFCKKLSDNVKNSLLNDDIKTEHRSIFVNHTA